MTVSVKRNKVQYTGDNSTTAFSVTFPYTEKSQIKVYLGSTLQTITTHYTLTDPGATGTVTFLTPPGTGVNVSLIRETDYLQGVDYVNNDALDAETLEKAFDKLTMMAQQLDAKIDASVGFDETVAGTTSLKLASDATDLAGKLLAFDDSGNFVTTQEIGTFKGTDSTTTTAAYVVRDLIRDDSNDNVYFTKQDAPIGVELTNTTYFELLVDVATVRTLKVAAETARTGAETAETNAAASLASFQGQYKSAATNPYGGAEDEGDLWYDETNNILKYYNGTSFEPVTTSLASVTDNYLTISDQVITAGTVPISLGGTSATSASGARTALELEIGTDVQAYDAGLADIAGLAVTDGNIIVGDGTNWVAESGATARTSLGLAIGTNVQAFDQALTDISSLAVTDGNFIVGDGTNWVAESGATARTSLGLGTAATTDSTAYATSTQGTTADSALQDVVDDSTPQLGGNLDVNGNSIVSASDGNIAITPNGTGNVSLGNFTFDADQTVGVGQDNYVLTYDHSTTSISLEAASGGSAISNVVEDTSPQLGGPLDVNGQTIVSASAGNIAITPDTTGKIILDGLSWPTADGSADQVLKTDGAGNLSFVDQSGGGLSDGDKGDITVSSSGGTWTIDNAAVSYAKIQNVSATDKILGRSTAGAGSVEEITCTSAGRALLDDVDASAQRGTLGLGTIATQDSNSVSITGGTIDGAVIGGSTAAAGTFTTFTSTGIDDNASSTALTIDSSGNVGIGTTPTGKLSVNGEVVVDTNVFNKLQLLDTVNSDVPFVVSSGTGAATIGNDVNSVTGSEYIQLHSSNELRFGTSATGRMRIDSSGNIGAPSGTNIYNASDERLKQNITELSGCLQKVLSMRGVSFNWINEFCDSEADKTLYGLIAQELQIVDANLVDSFSDNTITAGSVTVNNPLRVNEKFIIPMLVESIKEQQSQIDALTARIEALEATS